MPDDSSPDFHAAQQRHGQKIHDERLIMDQFGVSRSQAREALVAFAQQERARSVAAPATTVQVTGPAPTVVALPGTKFEAKPFTIGGTQDVTSGGESPTPELPTPADLGLVLQTLHICIAGEPFSIELYGNDPVPE